LKQEGLLALACGKRSVRFRPALCLSRADAGAGLEIVRRSLRSL
jgi:4-aminobutyrate aminotransferase-like enzyme